MPAGPEEIAEGVRRLRAGEPVIVPTDTLYGLACDAMDAGAVDRVFALKDRPPNQPVSVLVSSVEMAAVVVGAWPEAAERLAGAFWPGALTLVLARGDGVPDAITGGGTTIGVRMPRHPIALALIEAFGGPVVGTSANRTGSTPPSTPEAAGVALAGDDLYLLDGGVCPTGIASTVVDVSGGVPAVLRPGSIGATEIRAAAG